MSQMEHRFGADMACRMSAPHPLQRLAVRYFRWWNEGPAGQAAIRRDLRDHLAEDASAAHFALEQVFHLCHHAPTQPACANAKRLDPHLDESRFATFIEAATIGTDEAFHMACALAPAPRAHALIGAAGMFGLALVHITVLSAMPACDLARSPRHLSAQRASTPNPLH
jgi:hypothetical protein